MTSQIKDNDQRYGAVSRALHWGAAVLFAALAVLGWAGDDLPRDGSFNIMALHVSLGVAFLLLVFARIVWRVYQGWPDFRDAGGRLMHLMARWAHLALLGLMVALPVTGWIVVSAAGQDTSFFGLFSLPDIVPASEGLEDGAEEAHEALVTLMLVLVGLHVAAALKHRFWDRDRVMERMAG